MKALNEFKGVDHVSIHVPDEDGDPLCSAPREQANDLYGPHEVAVTPSHVDVCPTCRELVPDEDLHNSRYVHAASGKEDERHV